MIEGVAMMFGVGKGQLMRIFLHFDALGGGAVYHYRKDQAIHKLLIKDDKISIPIRLRKAPKSTS